MSNEEVTFRGAPDLLVVGCAGKFALIVKKLDLREMLVSRLRISLIQRSCASATLLVSALPLFSAAPVANNDSYVVDVGGNLSIRKNFLSTMTTKDPSMYWNADSAETTDTSVTINKGSDAIDPTDFAFTGNTKQSVSPHLRPTDGFKGFDSGNDGWGFGSYGGGSGYINKLITPDDGWGSDLGAVSFWFKTDSSGGGYQRS